MVHPETDYVLVWSGKGSFPWAEDWPHQRTSVYDVQPIRDNDVWFTKAEMARINANAPTYDMGWRVAGYKRRGRPPGSKNRTPRQPFARRKVTVTACVIDACQRALSASDQRRGVIRCPKCRAEKRTNHAT